MSKKSPLNFYPDIPLCQFDSLGQSVFKECCDPAQRCCEDNDCRGLNNPNPDYPDFRAECVNTTDVKCIAQSRDKSKCSYEFCEDGNEEDDEITKIDRDNEYVSILGKWGLETSNEQILIHPKDKYTKDIFEKNNILTTEVTLKGEFNIQFSKITADIYTKGFSIHIISRAGKTLDVNLDDVCDINKMYSFIFHTINFYGYRLWDSKIDMLQVKNNIIVDIPIKWDKLNFVIGVPLKKIGDTNSITNALCTNENFNYKTYESNNTKSKLSVQTIIGIIIGIITIMIGALLLLLYKD